MVGSNCDTEIYMHLIILFMKSVILILSVTELPKIKF
jgi:hypothetical protein